MSKQEDIQRLLIDSITAYVDGLHQAVFETGLPNQVDENGVITGRAAALVLRGLQDVAVKHVANRALSEEKRFDDPHFNPLFPRIQVHEVSLRELWGKDPGQVAAFLRAPQREQESSDLKVNWAELRSLSRLALNIWGHSNRVSEHQRAERLPDFTQLICTPGSRICAASICFEGRGHFQESHLVGLGITLTDFEHVPDREQVPLDYIRQNYPNAKIVRPTRVGIIDRIRLSTEQDSEDPFTLLWRNHPYFKQVSRQIHQALRAYAEGAVEVTRVAVDKPIAQKSARNNGFIPIEWYSKFGKNEYQWYIRTDQTQNSARQTLPAQIEHRAVRKNQRITAQLEQVGAMTAILKDQADPLLIVGPSQPSKKIALTIARLKPERPVLAILTDTSGESFSWRREEPNLRSIYVRGVSAAQLQKQLSETLDHFQTRRGTDLILVHTSLAASNRKGLAIAKLIDDLGVVIQYSLKTTPPAIDPHIFHQIECYEQNQGGPKLSIFYNRNVLGRVSESLFDFHPEQTQVLSSRARNPVFFAATQDLTCLIPCYEHQGRKYLGCLDSCMLLPPAIVQGPHDTIDSRLLIQSGSKNFVPSMSAIGFGCIQGRLPEDCKDQNERNRLIEKALQTRFNLTLQSDVRLIDSGPIAPLWLSTKGTIALFPTTNWEHQFSAKNGTSLVPMEIGNIIVAGSQGALHDPILEFAAWEQARQTGYSIPPWSKKLPVLGRTQKFDESASLPKNPEVELKIVHFDKVIQGDSRIRGNQLYILGTTETSAVSCVILSTIVLRQTPDGTEFAIISSRNPLETTYQTLPQYFLPKSCINQNQTKSHLAGCLQASGLNVLSTIENLGGFLCLPQAREDLFIETTVHPYIAWVDSSHSRNSTIHWIKLESAVESSHWSDLDLTAKVLMYRAAHAIKQYKLHRD